MKISSNIVFVRFEGLRLLDLLWDANLNSDIKLDECLIILR